MLTPHSESFQASDLHSGGVGGVRDPRAAPWATGLCGARLQGGQLPDLPLMVMGS